MEATGEDTRLIDQGPGGNSDEEPSMTAEYGSIQDNRSLKKENKNISSTCVSILNVLVVSLGLLVISWGVGNVLLAIFISSTAQLSERAEAHIMAYINDVDGDKLVSCDNFWKVSIGGVALLSLLCSALANTHFKKWNPWPSIMTCDDGIDSRSPLVQGSETWTYDQSDQRWTRECTSSTELPATETSETPTPSQLSKKLDPRWSKVLTVLTFITTAVCFGIILAGCYCLVLGIHLYYDAHHPNTISNTSQAKTHTSKLQLVQYNNINYWIVVTATASGIFLPTATFTFFVLTKGRLSMTDAFVVIFGFLKIREVWVYSDRQPRRLSIVWCFADVFFVTKRWKRWASAIALWFIVWFFSSTFISQFAVMGLYQYTIRQGPNCNDTDVWDCFTLSRKSDFYRYMSPIFSDNCSVIRKRDPILCIRIGDISFAGGDGFEKAMGISTSVVGLYLLVLTVVIRLIAKICSSDHVKLFVGMLLFVVSGLLVVFFAMMVAIDNYELFLSYATQRYQLLKFAILGSSLGGILLLSDYKRREPQPLEVPEGAEVTFQLERKCLNKIIIEKDDTTKERCVLVTLGGLILYLLPLGLVALDQKYTT